MITSLFVCLALMEVATIEAQEQPTFNLTELGFYDPARIEVRAVGKNYLFSTLGPGEEALKIVNRNGDVLHTYEKRGQGPEELSAQGILGVSPSRIYVYARHANMMVFDHQLNLIKPDKPLKKFTHTFGSSRLSGIYTKPNQLLVLSTLRSDHFVNVFSFEDQGNTEYWQPTSQQLAKANPFSKESSFKVLFDEETSSFHGGVLFTYRVIVKPDRTYYRILAHRDFNGVWEPVVELYNDVEGFDLWLTDTIAIVNNVFVTKDGGYAVEFTTKKEDAESHMSFNYFIDRFDGDGRFLKRLFRGSHGALKIPNTNEVYSIESQNEDDILVPLLL